MAALTLADKKATYLQSIAAGYPDLPLRQAQLHTDYRQHNDILIINDDLVFRFPSPLSHNWVYLKNQIQVQSLEHRHIILGGQAVNQEKLWLEFSSLPPHAQKLVLDFIAFMQKCYNQVQFLKRTEPPPLTLADEPFVGMWQDREDLADSATWVRETRQQEWG